MKKPIKFTVFFMGIVFPINPRKSLWAVAVLVGGFCDHLTELGYAKKDTSLWQTFAGQTWWFQWWLAMKVMSLNPKQ